MCIKDNFNDVLQNGDWYEVSNFRDDCECCVKYGSCDYYSMLVDRLSVIEEQIKTVKICPRCNSRLYKSPLSKYTYFCPECFEDFYKMEVNDARDTESDTNTDEQ